MATTKSNQAKPLRDVVVFAVDDSGSTWNIPSYWTQVEQRYNEYLAEYDAQKIIPLLWSTKLSAVTHSQLRDAITQRKGAGGTRPSLVASYLVHNHAQLFNVTKLCIITDGQINKPEVEHCDRILTAEASAQYQASPVPEIEACLFGPYNPDLSVVAPFARAAKFTIRTNSTVLAEGDASLAVESSGLLDEIKTPEDLLARFEELNRIIVVQNLGKTNVKLRDRLLEVQKRLMEWIAWDNRRKLAEISAATRSEGMGQEGDGGDGFVYSNPIMAALAKGDYQGAVMATKHMIDVVLEQGEEAVEDPGKRVARLIGRLVDACTLGSFAIGALQSRRAQRATLAAAPESGVPSVVEQDDPDMPSRFECPILLDDASVPVLLITTDKHYQDDYSMPVDSHLSDSEHESDMEPDSSARPSWTCILDGADQFAIDDITNCPLNLLKYPDLISRLASRLDHAISTEAFTGMYNAHYGTDMVSPFTRQPILGCIPLGTHHQHAHLGSFVVRRITTKGAVLGNAHLWVAAVYLVIKHHVPRLAENEPFMAAFRRHLKYRLLTFESNVALSGLPGFPMFKTPLAVGLWYCLSGSSALFADKAEMHGQERLRQMWGVAKYMRELVEGVLGWPAGGAWETRANVLRAFAYLMSKKNEGDRVFADVRRLYQGSVVVKHSPLGWASQVDDAKMDVDGEDEATTGSEVVVLVDGPATSDMVRASPAAWLLDILPLNTIVKLASLVDPQKKFGDVPLLPSDLANLPMPEPKVNYGYDYAVPCTDGPTPICPATLRPFVQDVRDRKHWSERATSVFKCPVQDQLSAYSLFINFVETRKAFPRSPGELIEYFAVRESGKAAENHPRDTLPRDVVDIAEEVVAAYHKAFALIREQEGAEPNVARFKKIVSKTYNKETRKELEDAWVKANGGVRKVKTMYML